jgi:hypothetical protein
VVVGDPLQPGGEEAALRALLAESHQLLSERAEGGDEVRLVLFEGFAERIEDPERRGNRLFIAGGPDEGR